VRKALQLSLNVPAIAVLDRVGASRLTARLAHAPKDAILAANAKLPVPLQRFRPEGMVSTAERPLRILFPPNGAKLDVGAGPKLDPVAVKVAGGTQPLTVLVNGAPVATTDKRTTFFAPDGPGFVRLTVMDAKGASDSVLVRVQ
jgi:penicillin-binding protein 1C